MSGWELRAEDVAFLVDIVRTGRGQDIDHDAVRALGALPLGPAVVIVALSTVREAGAWPRARAATAQTVGRWEAAARPSGYPVADLGGPGTDELPDATVLNAAEQVRDSLFGAALPADVRSRLGELPDAAVAGLLAELIEDLLMAAERPRADLDAATRRLKAVAGDIGRRGARPVAAVLPDPRAVEWIQPHQREWADRVLCLVHPRHAVRLARRILRRARTAEQRARVVRLLAAAAPGLGAVALRRLALPGTAGTWPSGGAPMLRLLELARPEREWMGPQATAEPRRTAVTVCPRLGAPAQVEPGSRFPIEIGLSPYADPAVQGSVRVPADTFVLDMEVVAEGCEVAEAHRVVEVTPAAAFPRVLVEVHAPAVPRACRITVLYRVGGERIGTAARTVHVGSGAVPPMAVAELRAHWDVLLGDGPAPDVDIVMLRDAVGRRLHWSCRSRHDPRPVEVDCDLPPNGFLDRLFAGLDERVRTPAARRAGYLRSIGAELGQGIPDQLYDLLRGAHDATGKPPTLLLSTQGGDIPWELAAVDEPWVLDAPHVLGAQAVIGRWPLPYRDADAVAMPPPPAGLRLTGMAVTRWPGEDLPKAAAEAIALQKRYGAVSIAFTDAAIGRCLSGSHGVQVFHVAAHGSLDGIQLDPWPAFDDLDIRAGGPSPVRMAFFNGCRLGRIQQGWHGDFGVAPAMIAIGAGAVIAPLWDTVDSPAVALVERFYEAVLGAGEPPAEVLRTLRATGLARGAVDQAGYLYFGHPQLRVTWAGPAG